MEYTIPQKGKIDVKTNIFQKIALACSCYLMIFPVIILDIFITQFQFIYFGIENIPKINRKDYIVIDRHLLPKLNWIQKINCVYCEYTNGMFAYAKAVGNQMEIYSCAIKHQRNPKDHGHHKKFFERKEFE